MNVWEILGLPISLVLSPETVEEYFRTASEGSHPDAGGKAGEFEAFREARDLLGDDFRRLEAWLEVQGVEIAHSGAVSAEVGEMFVRVNELTTGVDDWAEAGSTKASGLGKALWQKQGFEWKARLEELLDELAKWQEKEVATFEGLEESLDFAKALSVRATMGFQRKWRASLQERFGKIWEGLV